MKKRILFLWVLLLSTTVYTFAYDFYSHPFSYNVTSDSTVEVIDCEDNIISFFMTEFVTNDYNGTTYRITRIGNEAFYNCSNLTDFTLPNSITSIGDKAFYNCSNLTDFTLPNSITSIGYKAFYNCTSLTSITLPNSVTSIGGYAFNGTSWYDNQPNGVIYINNALYCYKGTMPQGTSIIVKEGTTSISGDAFYDCSGLTSITIPNSVTSIGDYAFYGCSGLTSITIPNSVTSIGDWAFYGCSGLTSITIPNSVTSIGDRAFYGCTKLQEITFKPITPPTGCGSAFSTRYVGNVYIPCGTKTAYTEAITDWEERIFTEMAATISVATEDSLKGTVRVEQQAESCNGDAIISATPAEHYRFAQWTDGNTENPRTVVVTRDTTYTAEFVPIGNVTIVYDAKQGVVSGEGTYDYGTQVQLLATPAEHYRFAQWNDGNTDNPRTVVVTGDATYTAEFIPICNITVVYDIKQGYVSGDGTYDLGTRVRLVAEPNSGYEFSQWSDGTTYNPYIFAATEDLTLEALFIPTTAIEDIHAEDIEGVQKVLYDGQMYILRNGKAYDIVGREVEF